MFLTPQEKKVVKAIENGTVFDAYSLLNIFHRSDLRVLSIKPKIGKFHLGPIPKDDVIIGNLYENYELKDCTNININNRSESCILYEGKSSLYKIFANFLNLLFRLEKNNLILFLLDNDLTEIINYRLFTFIVNSDRSTFRNDGKVESLFNNDGRSRIPTLYQRRISPTADLTDFVEHGFKTKVERHNRKTFWISIVSIIIALGTSLGSIWLNIRSNNESQELNTELAEKYDQYLIELQRLNKKVETLINDKSVKTQ